MTTPEPAAGASSEEPLFEFRTDLIVTQQGDAFIIKDPVKNTFARLGTAEYLVARHFDGRSSLEAICDRLKAERDLTVSVDSLRAFRDRLHDKQLLLKPGEEAKPEDASIAGSSGLLSRIIIIPIPIKLNPDVFLTRLHAWTRRLFFRPGYVVFTILVFLLACHVWISQWGAIVAQAKTLSSIKALVTFWFVFAVSVSAHEIAHGLTTKAFGGEVRRMGLFLYFFNLAFYTDVSDAWMFPSKAKQILVIWAGAYTTIVLCAVSTVLWRITIPGTEANQIFFMGMTMNAFGSAFTLTPFLRGDGYYLVSSILEIPNLRAKSFDYAGARLRRWLSGADVNIPKATEREARIYVGYAVSTTIFLTLFFGAAAYKAAQWVIGHFRGLGLMLVLWALHDRLGSPFARIGALAFEAASALVRTARAGDWAELRRTVAERVRARLSSVRRRGPLAVTIACFVVAVLCWPHPLTVSAPFRVIHTASSAARTKRDGVVQEILVRLGERVERGQVVARLVDVEWATKRDAAVARLAEAEARLAYLRRGFRPEQRARARAHVDELEARVKQAEARLARSRSLSNEGLAPGLELAQREADVRLSEAVLKQAREDLALALHGYREEEIAAVEARVQAAREDIRMMDVELSWTTVASPASGVVVTSDPDIRARIGISLPRGTELLSVVDAAELVARVEVSERDARDVLVGSRVALRTYQDPEREHDVALVHVEPTIGVRDPVAERQSVVSIKGYDLGPTVRERTYVAMHADLGQLTGRLQPGTTGMAKISCGDATLGSLLVRRLARSTMVDLWSWW